DEEREPERPTGLLLHRRRWPQPRELLARRRLRSHALQHSHLRGRDTRVRLLARRDPPVGMVAVERNLRRRQSRVEHRRGSGGDLSPSSFQLDDDSDGTLPNTRTFSDLTPQSGYSLAEDLPSGWVQIDAACSDGSPVSNVDVAAGETVTCTFVNTRSYVRPKA